MANRFGSTSDMVIRPVEEHGATLLLAIDERGLYLTSRTYVDRNVADPNRYTAARATVPARLAALALDAAALAAANVAASATSVASAIASSARNTDAMSSGHAGGFTPFAAAARRTASPVLSTTASAPSVDTASTLTAPRKQARFTRARARAIAGEEPLRPTKSARDWSNEPSFPLCAKRESPRSKRSSASSSKRDHTASSN